MPPDFNREEILAGRLRRSTRCRLRIVWWGVRLGRSGVFESATKTEQSVSNVANDEIPAVKAANFPMKPVRPYRRLSWWDWRQVWRRRIGCFWETLDSSSFKKGDEIDAFVNVSLLATLPALVTRGSVLEQRRASRVALASIGTVAVRIICAEFWVPCTFEKEKANGLLIISNAFRTLPGSF